MAKTSIPPGQPGTILLVDDEVELVQAVSTMLRAEFGEHRTRATSDPNEALRWVKQEKPSVLITDVRMPGLSGLDLMAKVHETWGATPTIVITAFPTEAVKVGARRGSFLFLPKPFSFRSLVDAVQQLEAAPPSFSGAIAVSTLTDLLQLYAISGSTGVIKVRSGEHRGEVWFDRGQVTHAACGDVVGFDAFCTVLRWPKGSFLWQFRRTEERSINMGLSELMLEAYRIYDEQQQAQPASMPPSAPPPSPTSPPPPREASTESHRMLERLRFVDGFTGAALVDSESGATLDMLGGSAGFEAAASEHAEMVRAKRRTVRALGLDDDIEDILITLGKQYHLIRPLRSRPGVFFYVTLDRTRANLAAARMFLADAEGAALL